MGIGSQIVQALVRNGHRKERPSDEDQIGFAQFQLPTPPSIDSDEVLPSIVASDAFKEADKFFEQTPPWHGGLVCAAGLALLYQAVRALRPTSVVEIGTNKGWTSQVIARALSANDNGTVHTIGPFDSWRFLPLFERWPVTLRKRTKFHPINSAAFFQDAIEKNQRHDLFFIDGNHDYEFALFDIQCTARCISPGGFVFIDDADQADVRRAVDDFRSKRQDWINCSDPTRDDILGDQDFFILQAPEIP